MLGCRFSPLDFTILCHSPIQRKQSQEPYLAIRNSTLYPNADPTYGVPAPRLPELEVFGPPLYKPPIFCPIPYHLIPQYNFKITLAHGQDSREALSKHMGKIDVDIRPLIVYTKSQHWYLNRVADVAGRLIHTQHPGYSIENLDLEMWNATRSDPSVLEISCEPAGGSEVWAEGLRSEYAMWKSDGKGYMMTDAEVKEMWRLQELMDVSARVCEDEGWARDVCRRLEGDLVFGGYIGGPVLEERWVENAWS